MMIATADKKNYVFIGKDGKVITSSAGLENLEWDTNNGQFMLKTSATAASTTATTTAGTTAADTTAAVTTTAGTTTPALPAGFIIYREQSSPESLDAFTTTGGMAVFINAYDSKCEDNFNQDPLPVGTATQQCTHFPMYNTISTFVKHCESLTKDTCKTTPGCVTLLMQGEVEPATTIGVCTHSNQFNMDANVVSMCITK